MKPIRRAVIVDTRRCENGKGCELAPSPLSVMPLDESEAVAACNSVEGLQFPRVVLSTCISDPRRDVTLWGIEDVEDGICPVRSTVAADRVDRRTIKHSVTVVGVDLFNPQILGPPRSAGL